MTMQGVQLSPVAVPVRLPSRVDPTTFSFALQDIGKSQVSSNCKCGVGPQTAVQAAREGLEQRDARAQLRAGCEWTPRAPMLAARAPQLPEWAAAQ